MSNVYVLSTMTNSVSYAFWSEIKNGQDVPVMRDKITIRGGAGLPSARSGFGEMMNDKEGIPIWTAAGVVTPLEKSRYDILVEHPLFKKHLDKGLVKVVNSDITGDHKAVKELVRDMNRNDGFAQLTPETVKSQVRGLKISTEDIDSDAQFRH